MEASIPNFFGWLLWISLLLDLGVFYDREFPPASFEKIVEIYAEGEIWPFVDIKVGLGDD